MEQTLKVDPILASALQWLLNYKKFMKREFRDESAKLHIVFDTKEANKLTRGSIANAMLIQDVNIERHRSEYPDASFYEVVAVNMNTAEATFKLAE